MSLYLCLSFALPVSVLLILCGAFGAGAIAATWFAGEQERNAQTETFRLERAGVNTEQLNISEAFIEQVHRLDQAVRTMRFSQQV